MADITLTYKGATIAELSASGSKTLETAGKYCEADILLEYIKSEGLPFIQHFQHVQAETKDYTTGGFASWFISEYLNHGEGLYFGTVNNPSEYTNQYRAVSFVYPNFTGTTGDRRPTSIWTRANNRYVAEITETSILQGASFYVYQGADINIYYVPLSYFSLS